EHLWVRPSAWPARPNQPTSPAGAAPGTPRGRGGLQTARAYHGGTMKTSLRILASTGILAVLTSAGAAFGQAIDAQVQTPAQTPAAQPQPAQPPAQGQPQLVFDTLEHDFGRIPDTDPVEYKFRFVNRGSGVLKFFVPLQASCGCTAGNPRSPKNPDVDQTEFGPGEEGLIKVSFAP